MIACVAPDRVREVWKAVHGTISHALHRGNVGTQIEQVERDLFGELAQLWVAVDGVAVTQITKSRHRDHRTCTLIAFAGDYAKCIEYLPTLEGFGKAEGCSEFMVLGRDGWQRRLKDHGYATAYTVLRKEI